MTTFCKLSELPKIEGQPQGCAWGYFVKDKSKRDELGTLNLLTPERVQAAAASQIKTGIRVQLDWGMENVQFPGFGRKGLTQKIIDKSNPNGWVGCDDEIHFNTQCGSQWDSYRHAAHQATAMYYNGLSHEELIAGGHTKNGINEWCKAGGIAGRGVLLDWVRWKQLTQPDQPLPSPVERFEIPHTDLEEVAKFQGTTFEIGDVLIVRSGFVKWHNEASEDERKRGTFHQALYIGIKATVEALEWFWDHHFAAVAGDAVAFESWPPMKPAPILHEWFLSQWGTPIGEMWDLETLSTVCEQQKRWTFFFTSAPLNVPGGVGTTPNAIAIF